MTLQSTEALAALSNHKDDLVATMARSMLVLVRHIEDLERQLQAARHETRPARAGGAAESLKLPRVSNGPTFLRHRKAEAVA